jgi:hypothetical protein
MLGIINNQKEDWWKCCAIFVQQFTKTVLIAKDIDKLM